MGSHDARLGPAIQAAEGLLGPCLGTEPLGGGQSGAGVYRVRCAGGLCVAKVGAAEREFTFYTAVAPTLARQGVAAPKLLAAIGNVSERALLLEDVERALPRERWLADAEVLAYLRRVHALSPHALPIAAPFRPRWTANMSRALARLVPQDWAAMVGRLQRRSRALFAPACVISGDPNPTNWGVRPDGTLVLFDWERVGYGTPALDLAITVPGLGSPDDYQRVAEGYQQSAPAPAQPALGTKRPERLARAIAVGKVWTVAEYVTMVRAGDERVARFAGLLPDWLEQLRVFLRETRSDGRSAR